MPGIKAVKIAQGEGKLGLNGKIETLNHVLIIASYS